jgi:hypothetical protein
MFNAGVELGQLTVIVTAFLLVENGLERVIIKKIRGYTNFINDSSLCFFLVYSKDFNLNSPPGLFV